MAFTTEVKKRIRAAMPVVHFDEMRITPGEYETMVEFLEGGKTVMTKRSQGMFLGDTLRLKGIIGDIPTKLDFEE